MHRLAGIFILFVATTVLGEEQKDIPVLRDENVDHQTVHAFDVIGINFVEQKAAVKMVYEVPGKVNEEGDLGEAAVCGYAGMQEHPRAGVILAIVDLSDDENLETFTVYRSVTDKKECIPRTQSEKTLQEAKEAIRKIGIDPQARLEGKKADFDKNGLLNVPIKSGTLRFELSEKSYLEQTSTTPKWCDALINSAGCLELKLIEKTKGIPLLHKRLIYTRMMASSGGMAVTTYFSNGEHVVFLGRVSLLCHFQGCPSSEEWFFSKAL